MTEATVATHLLRLRKRNGKEGSIGEPLPGTSCKIIDPDTGKPVPRNKPGELWVKGPQITKAGIDSMNSCS
jgi:long-chain acyl-CoA synthetase